MIKVVKDALDLCLLNYQVNIFNSGPATIVRGSADRRDDFDDDGDDGNDDDGQNGDDDDDDGDDDDDDDGDGDSGGDNMVVIQ